MSATKILDEHLLRIHELTYDDEMGYVEKLNTVYHILDQYKDYLNKHGLEYEDEEI